MIYPTLGLSRKKHLPIFKILGGTYYPHQAFNLMIKSRKFKKLCNDIFVFKYNGDTLFFHPLKVVLWINELSEWKRHYDILDLQSKTVLDVGAGCGETAAFFYGLGAKKVICVEKDQELTKILYLNKDFNGWDCEIYNEPFSIKHLKLRHDFAKIDIEGGESLLLEHKVDLKPTVLEYHKKEIAEGLQKLYNATILSPWIDEVGYAYINCSPPIT